MIYVGWVILVGAGALMVSNIRYYSFKEVNLKGRASFKVLLVAILIIIVIIFKPSAVLFTFFFVYALSGLIMTSIEVRKKRRLKKRTKR